MPSLLPLSLNSPQWGWNGLGEIVYARTYSRWLPDKDRRETWEETVARAVYGAQAIQPQPYSTPEIDRLYKYVHGLKGSFSGRWMWQGGTDMIEKFGAAGSVNCYGATIETVEDFVFTMDMLMVGGGVGFSVERSMVHELPRVKDLSAQITHERTNDADFIVPDKRQGWSDLLRRVLNAYLHTGEGFTYSTVLIRPYGAPLHTFGGTASGPTALIDGITDICRLLDARVGKKLRSVDALDILNIIGRIVVAGSSRRSAQLGAGDPDDVLFLRAKRWDKGNIPAWRANANLSLYADALEEVPNEFWRPYEDGSGEPYGLLNRRLAQTTGRTGEALADPNVRIYNPCAEEPLPPRGTCNLATLFLPNIESPEELHDLTCLLYRTCKAITLLPHPDAEAQRVMRRDSRIGISVTGVLQATDEQRSWLGPEYLALRSYDRAYSRMIGAPESIRLTTVQPSGTLSLLPGVTPGLHGAHDAYYIRRVRMGSSDPLVDTCRTRGYPVVYDRGLDGNEERTRFVVEFPCETPEGTPLISKLTAVDQLEWLRWAQTEWADAAVSVTVSYRPEELSDIKRWLADHYDTEVKSVSFLRYEDHNFALPPYESITEREYHERAAAVDLSVPVASAAEDPVPFDSECGGGACPVR
jgi:ribonucleoside-triphosphate reductase (thioredoxin)